VIKSSGGFFGKDYIFGGFTTVPWTSPMKGEWKYDSEAFLFSLTHKKKLRIRADMVAYAVYHDYNYLATFGNGSDIDIPSDCNKNQKSYSTLGRTYWDPEII
jgi:hypothetical protein